MAYYDPLIQIWPSVQGEDTAAKLAALNAETVGGPNVDVQPREVLGKLMLTSAFLTLAGFAQGASTGDAAHDNALGSAKMLMAILNTPNAPSFGMSDPATFAAVKGMMDALLAQEAATAGSTGFTQAVHDALLALAATTRPWWQANGYTSPVGQTDLDAAGLN